MAESRSSLGSIRSWVVEHKLRTVGCLWLSGIGSSIAYNWSRPNMKTSVKIIHARLHAQALTLAALAGAAVVEYYDQQSKPRSDVDKYPNQFIAHPQKIKESSAHGFELDSAPLDTGNKLSDHLIFLEHYMQTFALKSLFL